MSLDSSFQSDKHIKQNILPVANSIFGFVRDFGLTQSVCPKINDCDYVIEEIKKTHFSFPQANGYVTLVCEKYPLACELNQEELESARDNK